MTSAPPGPSDAPAIDLSGVSAAVDRLTLHASDWSVPRLLDEGLDLVRDASWADASALLSIDSGGATLVHARPTLGNPDRHIALTGDGSGPRLDTPLHPLPLEWFPWGLGPIRPDRFVLVEDARSLTTHPEAARTLGSLGIRSCLHLPLRQRGRAVGAIQVFWSQPRLVWDDDRGRLLRTLGRFLLSCADRDRR